MTTNLAFRPESLRRLRIRAGFAQRQLADAAGLPGGTINNAERNPHARLTDDQISRVAAVLGVPVDALGAQQPRLRVPDRR